MAHLCQTYEVSQRRVCTAIVAERSRSACKDCHKGDGGEASISATGVLALLAALTNVDHARRIYCMQVGRRVRRDLEAGSA